MKTNYTEEEAKLITETLKLTHTLVLDIYDQMKKGNEVLVEEGMSEFVESEGLDTYPLIYEKLLDKLTECIKVTDEKSS